MDRYREFISDRGWGKYHTPKNLSMALSVEVSELVELFQWKDNAVLEEESLEDETREKVKEEIADVILYTLRIADIMNIEIGEAVEEKLRKNEEKYDLETVESTDNEMERWIDR